MWKEMIQRVDPDYTFHEPATPDQIAEVEQAFNVTLPGELKQLLLESNGVDDSGGGSFIFSIEEILERNLEMRQEMKEDWMPFDHLLFFGGTGDGDMTAFPIINGRIDKPHVFIWQHETDSRELTAYSLKEWLDKYLNDSIYGDSTAETESLTWKEMIQRVHPDYTFHEPATPEQIAQVEQTFNVTLPDELKQLLLESNGVQLAYGTEFLWSVETILKENLSMRQEVDWMPFDHLLFFGGTGDGNLSAFPIINGQIDRPEVFIWDHENDSRMWAGETLKRYIELYLNNELY
jgi:cell wall assembly regulator SMI1